MDGRTDGQKYTPFSPSPGPKIGGTKHCAVDYPLHVSNSHTELGPISLNGLGEDSMDVERTDGRMERGDCNVPIAFIKKAWGNHIRRAANIIY